MNADVAKKLYNFVFHVALDGTVEVTTRENYRHLFNDRDKVLKFKDFDTAVDILSRTGGDPEKIEALLNRNNEDKHTDVLVNDDGKTEIYTDGILVSSQG